MPPLIVWALGVIGAAVLVKVLAKQARRIHAGLRPKDAAPGAPLREGVRTLERDPVTGIYRPK